MKAEMIKNENLIQAKLLHCSFKTLLAEKKEPWPVCQHKERFFSN